MCAQFVATTPILDMSRLQGKSLDSPEFKEFVVRLTQYLNLSSLAVNDRISGENSTVETDNGVTFWSLIAGQTPRAAKFKVIDFGALPNTALKQVAHNINVTNATLWTKIMGVATRPGVSGIPLPYASATLINNIELNVDATMVNITTGSDRTAYTTCYVYLEWI